MSANQKLLSDSEDLEFLKSLKEDFYTETVDSLEKSEALLLDFEQTQNDFKKVEYKRILHSIKGSAKAVEEDHFAKCIHLIEDSLMNLAPDSSMDLQLKLLDACLQYVKFKKYNEIENAEEKLSELDAILKK